MELLEFICLIKLIIVFIILKSFTNLILLNQIWRKELTYSTTVDLYNQFVTLENINNYTFSIIITYKH